MLYLILFLIIVCCLGVIFFVIKNKAVGINEVKIESESKEKLVEVKKRLIENRLQGKIVKIKDKLTGNIKQQWAGMVRIVKKIAKVPKLKRSGKQVLERKVETTNQAKDDLMEAQVLLRQRKLEEAEKGFISALKKDIKNIEAYMGLGEVYMAKKDWETAMETYKHVIKISPKYLLAYKELIEILSVLKNWNGVKEYAQKIFDFGVKEAWIYAGLGLAYRKTGYPEKAEEWYEKAVAIDPGNEKYLDCLLEASIMNKNKELVKKTFNTLSQVSSDQIKLQGYRSKIEIL